MQTYSHLILAAALRRPLAAHARARPGSLPPLPTAALLLGSVLPDIPLTAMGVVAVGRDLLAGVFNDPAFAGRTPGSPSTPEMLERSLSLRLFDDWFFSNPWVIGPHNLFHSPLLLAASIAAGYWLWRGGRAWGGWLFWLACSCMLHTLVDIPLHVNDGPLLLFPLSWELRYVAPISYWDPAHYGAQWSIFEHLLDAGLLISLAAEALWRRRAARPA